MPKKYDACSRLEIDGRDKPIWPRVGLTLTVKDDGKMYLFDARTQHTYFLFEREDKRQQASQDQHNQAKSDGYAPQFNDDSKIPF